jgi:hypothetical protein
MGKRFGLGLVVAWLACLAWPGCKGDYSSIIVPNEDGGRPPTEGGAPPVDAGDTCPTTTPIDLVSLPVWKRPTAPQPGKCQADDVVAMRDYLGANPKATNEEFENFVKNRDTVCHDCVFGDANGATWPPAPVLDGKVVTFDIGACYALVSGKEACGKATQNAWDCEFQACADCTAQSELDGCRARSRSTVCKATFDTSRADCTGIPTGTDSLCGSPFDSIRVQCVTTTVDAGKL